jgi:hypothetical protein
MIAPDIVSSTFRLTELYGNPVKVTLLPPLTSFLHVMGAENTKVLCSG